ncbi:ATPase [Peribacillus simplex]|nr:ATPase [Peribacillus simplex]
MKTGNLVILAGMSGTGKSKIVNCYAEALGLEDRGNFKKIPVRPFWQDDSDLLGYLDVLNNIYRPGDSGLIDFLVDADKEENKDKLYIVCFDEMNLARVEHYFSQFLSVLEETGENQRKIRLYNKDYQNRLYNSHQYNDTLKIGENVLFVGTVNLDESTHHFSDKVLDRANVIHLELRPFKEVARAAKEFDVTDSIGTAVFTKDQYFATRPATMEDPAFQLVDAELDVLWKIHKALKDSNDKLGVGFRIVRQIDHYLQCLPQSNVLSRDTAFDLQVLQRILTKVRGGEEQLAGLVGRYEKVSGEVKGSNLIDIFNEYKELYSFTESRKKVASLAKELVIYGHTL